MDHVYTAASRESALSPTTQSPADDRLVSISIRKKAKTNASKSVECSSNHDPEHEMHISYANCDSIVDVDRTAGVSQEDVFLDATTNQAFRQTVQNLGADAAVIVFERTRPVMRRHAYILGLNTLRHDQTLTAEILAHMERSWQTITDEKLAIMDLATLRRLNPFNSDRNSSDILPHEEKTIRLPAVANVFNDFEFFAFSVFRNNADSIFRMALMKRSDSGAFSNQIKDSMQLVQPGLAEIAESQMEVQRAQRRVGILEGMLDSISHGIFLLDHCARPFYCNDTAHALMIDTGALFIGSDQVLRCKSSEQTKLLHRAIKESIGFDQYSDEVIVKIQCNDGSQLLGFLMSAVGRDNTPFNRASILMIHRMKVHVASPALMRAFGLLKSEERFLTKFLEAPSLADTAAQLKLSEETARTYLKRICAKLGVRRQIELASVMFSLTPPLRRQQGIHDVRHG